MPMDLVNLLRRMSGGAPDIEDKTGGLLVQDYQAMPRSLQFRDNAVVPSETLKSPDMGDFPLLPVGDVVPLGRKPGPFQGPTPNSAEYMLGRAEAPGIKSINPKPEFWEQWMQRQLNRKRIEDMGGLRG